MPLIDRIRTESAAATKAPWQTQPVTDAQPPNTTVTGVFTNDADALLAADLSNGRAAILALYDAVKAYQPRMGNLVFKAPLKAQAAAINAALAALEK